MTTTWHLFNSSIFQDNPAKPVPECLQSPFWILLQSRMTEVMVTTGTTSAKLKSNHHHSSTTKPIPSFLQARCPLCRPINSVKATNKENKYHLHKLAHPSWPGVFQPCVWPPNAPDYFVRGHQAFHQPSDDSSLDYLRKLVYIFMWPSILQFTYIFACNDCYKPKERL